MHVHVFKHIFNVLVHNKLLFYGRHQSLVLFTSLYTADSGRYIRPFGGSSRHPVCLDLSHDKPTHVHQH